jgi:hypothetical protein
VADDLVKVKVKVSADGAEGELDVSDKAPTALARLFPTWATRGQARRELSDGLIRRAAAQGALDDAEIEYLAAILKPAEAKLIRQRAIAQRATRVLAESQAKEPLQLPAGSSSDDAKAPTAATTPDWLNRFWDDAGGVSDEMLQEIYARILAREATAPGTCSSGTLATLRYLDRDSAEQFAKILPFVVDGWWIPRDQLLDAEGIRYGMVMSLDDSGLVDSSATIHSQLPGSIVTQSMRDEPPLPVGLRWGTKLLLLSEPRVRQLPIYPLRRAGKELARVAEVERTDHHLLVLAKWLHETTGGKISAADMPSPDWSGDISALAFTEIHPPPSPAT